MGNSFFSNFPVIYYDPVDEDRLQAVSDIFRRFTFRPSVKHNADFFVNYRIKDGDRPDSISHKLYGTPDDWWIVLMMNDKVHPQYDWPLSSHVLDQYIDKKYPGSTLFVWDVKRNQNFNNGEVVTTPESQFVNYYWDATYRRISYETSTFSGNSLQIDHTITGSDSGMTAKIKRIVEFSRYALHHFSLNGVVTNTYLNPWDTAQNYLQGYILNSIDTHAVTNEAYEIHLNEQKREIKLLRPEFVQQVKRQANTILKSSSAQIREPLLVKN